MASVDTGGGEQKKGKPQQKTLRVDFTPMVDMLMLLITFFMFCTTLAKPQVMDIVMPSDDKTLKEEEKDQVKASKAITVLLGQDDKVYYYTGQITTDSYSDYTTLKETDFSAKGVRSVLLSRNADAVRKMQELKEKKANDRRMTEEDFKKQANEIKNDKEAQVVIIKATEEAKYENLVDILDEMQICSIGKYAIVDITDGDKFLIENLKTKGEYGSQHLAPKQ
ncbi:biopolymer transporter ExbD [Dysgonomonas sp. 25]|uniref:ExbD/TolR family protein n=1 Tax=Dysgonomonas sp. 25 TaxID=2302933 RepID=UPI0013D3358A|nr:biopolymer transporter ExbD [Dysgonomonas sp. 25]NDV69722.1 biopolymer transporter ExbD [Dysgonomonas sp. 25]